MAKGIDYVARMPQPRVDYSSGKLCSDCREVKPVSEFYLRRNRRDGEGFQSRCKRCSNRNRIRDRRTHTGVTRAQYLSLLATQCGTCAICGEAETTIVTRASGAVRGLAVDHDHATGQVRGLLCARCNTALGLLGDDPVTLRRAASYLEEYKICAV